MANRAVIIFKSGNQVSPKIHLQWYCPRPCCDCIEDKVKTLLKETQGLMVSSFGDTSYTSAEFVGVCKSETKEPLFVSISNLNDGDTNFLNLYYRLLSEKYADDNLKDKTDKVASALKHIEYIATKGTLIFIVNINENKCFEVETFEGALL